MLSKLKKRLQTKRNDSTESEVEVEKKATMEDGYDAKMEAMALAEAGAHELAHDTIVLGQMEPPKILVVGNEDTFTEPVLNYTIGLAERLGYEIVAMNVNTVMGHSGKFLSPFRKHLREEFEKRSAEAFSVLQEKLKDKGIRCEHVIKYGDFSKAVEDLHHEMKRIEFVVTEPEAHPERSETEVTIPVFSMQR